MQSHELGGVIKSSPYFIVDMKGNRLETQLDHIKTELLKKLAYRVDITKGKYTFNIELKKDISGYHYGVLTYETFNPQFERVNKKRKEGNTCE